MPIVIRELVVRASVSPNGDTQDQTLVDARTMSRLKKEITKEVTEQVLQHINRKKER